MITVGPSVLALDYANIQSELKRAEKAGADFWHVDIMDGHFVPNLTIGPGMVRTINNISQLPIHVHLMIDNPQDFVEPFIQAEADIISFHIEAVANDVNRSKEIIESIKKKGIRPAIAINPPTSLGKIEPLLDLVDWVLVMTVNPGFGGQEFISDVVEKIRALRKIYKADIEIDGGINDRTGRIVVEAGANILAAGTYIFKAQDMPAAIRSLKDADKGHS